MFTEIALVVAHVLLLTSVVMLYRTSKNLLSLWTELRVFLADRKGA